jgi:two-component system, chemotaxis family, chemotaxis protein CheY
MPQNSEIKSGERLVDLHVLIIDDDDAFITLIHAMLKSLGVGQVTRASSGAEAYQKMRKSERVIDCIICDYHMENGNGLQLLQAVRTATVNPVRPDACFILLTSSSDPETVSSAARLDVSGYLVKPVTKEKIEASITKARSRAIKIDVARYQRVALN